MQITWRIAGHNYTEHCYNKGGMMNSFAFSIPTQIQFGAGAARQVGSIGTSLSSGKTGPKAGALLIVDPGIQQAAWLKDILESIGQAGLPYQRFDEVKPNPKDEDVYEAASLIKENVGVVIAIGGGSTIDTAKGAALIAAYGGKISDYAGWGLVPGPVLPLVVIPTTAGSGSEATSWAVITDTASHTKLAIGDPNLAPRVAVVDPMLTLSLPAALTAATGMDALTHAIEAYVCALANPVNDLLALESIRLVATNLRRAVGMGHDLTAREGMMLASTLGGVAINNADVAGVHCLSEGMGSLYDAPHGLLNAILLPYFMAVWQNGCPERFARIAAAFGEPADPEEAVKQVVALNRSLNLPTLVEVGVKQSDLSRLANLAEANVSNSSNPIPMRAADYQAILERAISGLPPQA
jgi:alcohol dehydrogenase